MPNFDIYARVWTKTPALAFGFGLATALLPEVYGDVNVGRWAVGWLGIAGLLWKSDERVEINWWGLGLLILGVASLLWGLVWKDGIGELLQWTLLLGSFVVGARSEEDFRLTVTGFVAGLGVSSALAIGQLLGWHPVMEATRDPGLFGNLDYMAEAMTLGIVWAVAERCWWGVVACAPGLLIANYRGAWLAIAVVGIIWVWKSSRIYAVVLIIAGILALTAATWLNASKWNSANDRLAIWEDTIDGLNWKGKGIGQYYATYPEHQTREVITRPAHAHNDWLELAFELGPLGLLLGVGFAGSLLGSYGSASVLWLTFCLLALVGFPLHDAPAAIIGFLAAGRIWRASRLVRRNNASRPSNALPSEEFSTSSRGYPVSDAGMAV